MFSLMEFYISPICPDEIHKIAQMQMKYLLRISAQWLLSNYK